MRQNMVTGLALGLAFATTASAFFRLPCKSSLVVERADPIVSPGKISGHVHTIMGGNGFGFQMDYASTQYVKICPISPNHLRTGIFGSQPLVPDASIPETLNRFTY